ARRARKIAKMHGTPICALEKWNDRHEETIAEPFFAISPSFLICPVNAEPNRMLRLGSHRLALFAVKNVVVSGTNITSSFPETIPASSARPGWRGRRGA